MIRRISPAQFRAEVARRPVLPEAALAAAAGIVDAVRARGDAALIDCVERFERRSLCHAHDLWVEREFLARALAEIPADLRAALEHAAAQIRDYQTAILEPDEIAWSRGGKRIVQRSRPVARAGVYAPGGRAVLCSTVLMTAIPAAVAGVPELILAMPPDGEGRFPPAVLAAAALAGVSRILACGGAHAIAALALGTQSVPRVDALAGPGNSFVTAAKKLLFGEVAVDALAGPSEVLVIADRAADPARAAADLLAQAEHDPESRAVLLTDDAALADAVAAEIARRLAREPRRGILEKSLAGGSALVVVASLDEAVELANLAAPEHLSLAVENPAALAEKIRSAGAVFFGPLATEALGDYAAGPSHVLPTGGTARFASGLSANFFRRRTALIAYDAAALDADGPAAIRLATEEALPAHAESVAIRMNDRPNFEAEKRREAKTTENSDG